jgi:hypothetical protein
MFSLEAINYDATPTIPKIPARISTARVSYIDAKFFFADEYKAPFTVRAYGHLLRRFSFDPPRNSLAVELWEGKKTEILPESIFVKRESQTSRVVEYATKKVYLGGDGRELIGDILTALLSYPILFSMVSHCLTERLILGLSEDERMDR